MHPSWTLQASINLTVQLSSGCPELFVTAMRPTTSAVSRKAIQVPVSAKDAIVIGGIGYDKLRLSLNLPTSIRATSHDHLEAAARRFREIADEYQRDVIDVTPLTGNKPSPD